MKSTGNGVWSRWSESQHDQRTQRTCSWEDHGSGDFRWGHIVEEESLPVPGTMRIISLNAHIRLSIKLHFMVE